MTGPSEDEGNLEGQGQGRGRVRQGVTGFISLLFIILLVLPQVCQFASASRTQDAWGEVSFARLCNAGLPSWECSEAQDALQSDEATGQEGGGKLELLTPSPRELVRADHLDIRLLLRHSFHPQDSFKLVLTCCYASSHYSWAQTYSISDACGAGKCGEGRNILIRVPWGRDASGLARISLFLLHSHQRSFVARNDFFMLPEEDASACPREVGLPACRGCRIVSVTDGIVSSSCKEEDLLADDKRQEEENRRLSAGLLADWHQVLLPARSSSAQDRVTVTITSCGRPALLAETIRTFLAANTHPIEEVIIIEDSGNETLCRHLQSIYMSRGQDGEGEEEEASDPPFRILCNKERVGQVLSLDRVYQHVRTDFVFHLEDDWTCDGRGGFIEESLEVLQENPSCFQVHLRHRKSMSHPVHPQLFLTSHSGVAYRRLVYGWFAGDGLFWHGLSFGPGLRRKAHILLLSPLEALGSELQAQAAFYVRGGGGEEEEE